MEVQLPDDIVKWVMSEAERRRESIDFIILDAIEEKKRVLARDPSRQPGIDTLYGSTVRGQV